MRYASTFLSHSSIDKPLVEAVAVELGRRGVISWLDKNELIAGDSLGVALGEAIKRQATVTVFLSANAVASKWVSDELICALQSHPDPHILPVYLGDFETLVTAFPELERWIHTDGESVDKYGIVADPKMTIGEQSNFIADGIRKAAFRSVALHSSHSFIAYFDQRGSGDCRHGELTDPPECLRHLDMPVLVFRHDSAGRSAGEALDGAAWSSYWGSVRSTLGGALGSSCIRKAIYLAGGAQLALPFFSGKLLNRGTCADLYCYDRHKARFISNSEQERRVPLSCGDPSCETRHASIPALRDGVIERISLLLLREDRIGQTLEYLRACPSSPPAIWVAHGLFETDDQVWRYIGNVIAMFMRLKREHGMCGIDLYTSLPFHILPLLGANLLHVVDDVQFMEYRRESPIVLEQYVAVSDAIYEPAAP